MVAKKYDVVWTKRSQQHMEQIFSYINEQSPQNALQVTEDIILAVNKATTNPEIYNPYKYKHNNDGTYRAFEKHRYRISYRYKTNVIRVLRVRHSSMEPKEY